MHAEHVSAARVYVRHGTPRARRRRDCELLFGASETTARSELLRCASTLCDAVWCVLGSPRASWPHNSRVSQKQRLTRCTCTARWCWLTPRQATVRRTQSQVLLPSFHAQARARVTILTPAGKAAFWWTPAALWWEKRSRLAHVLPSSRPASLTFGPQFGQGGARAEVLAATRAGAAAAGGTGAHTLAAACQR